MTKSDVANTKPDNTILTKPADADTRADDDDTSVADASLNPAPPLSGGLLFASTAPPPRAGIAALLEAA